MSLTNFSRSISGHIAAAICPDIDRLKFVNDITCSPTPLFDSRFWILQMQIQEALFKSALRKAADLRT